MLAKNDKVDELSLDNLDGPAPAPTPVPQPIDPKLSLAVKFGDRAPYPKSVLDKLDSLFTQWSFILNLSFLWKTAYK